MKKLGTQGSQNFMTLAVPAVPPSIFRSLGPGFAASRIAWPMIWCCMKYPPTTCFLLHWACFLNFKGQAVFFFFFFFLQWKHILVQEPFASNGRLSVAPLAYPLQFHIPLQFHAAPPPYIMLCFSKTKGWTVGYGPQIAFICCEIFRGGVFAC